MEILDLRSRYIDCRHAGMSRQHSQSPGSLSEVGVMQCIMYIIISVYQPLHCRPMHNVFHHLLAGLCVGDLLFLLRYNIFCDKKYLIVKKYFEKLRSNLLLVPIALGADNSVTKIIYPIAECGYCDCRYN